MKQIKQEQSLLLYLFHNPAWNTHSDRVRWYIAVHQAPCTYRHIVSDCDTGKHRNTGTNPHIVPDGYRAGILKPLIALYHINRMSSRRKATIWCNKHIITKNNRSRIKYHKIMVRIKIFSKRNVAPIITPE